MNPRTRSQEPAAGRRLPPSRPAFYALNPPYTLWHLSYVILGAALAPALHYDRLAATVVAFFLALGVGAHALDELAGRPLRTRIARRTLVVLALAGLGGAIGIGLAGAVAVSPLLLIFIAAGAFLAPAYNLEWFGGRFHSGFWFAAAWGAFPFLTGYFAQAETFEPPAAFGAVAVFLLSLVQRTLSSRVRSLRRRVRSIEGRVLYDDGTIGDLDRSWALAADERALLLLSLAVPVAAVAALAARM